MHLIMVGCEYAGTTTLGTAISKWAEANFGGNFGFHDHWKIPHISHPPGKSAEENDKAYADWLAGKGEDPTRMGLSEDEVKQFMALSPKLKESYQRFHMEYHVSDSFYGDAHHNQIGFHIDEAVYAPLYYGYGGPGEYADRQWYARHIEQTVLRHAPDTILVLVKASPDIIRKRMKAAPHRHSLLQDKDIETVLAKFDEQFGQSFIRQKVSIDTSNASVEQSLVEFVDKVEPFITQADRLRMMDRMLKKLSA